MLNIEPLFEQIEYKDLDTGKEQEQWNFAKTASTLADYGYVSFPVTADKHGPDMIAHHRKTCKNLNIQLKGSRPTLNKKYMGKDILISYVDRETNEICLYDHDEAVKLFEKTPSAQTVSWLEKGQYSGETFHKNKFNHIIKRLPIS